MWSILRLFSKYLGYAKFFFILIGFRNFEMINCRKIFKVIFRSDLEFNAELYTW